MDEIRRRALGKIACVATGIFFNPFIVIKENSKNNPQAYKFLIKNGKVFSNGKLQKIYLAITNDGKIKLSKKYLSVKGKEIDARGKIVSAGFIDILADNTRNPQSTYRIFEEYKIKDGLTTVLQMHGGVISPASYHSYFDNVPHYVNYGIGVSVMRIRNKYKNLDTRIKQVKEGSEEGGLGVCHSIEYQPTPYDELLMYAKLAEKYDRPLFLHLRYSSEFKELEGVEEAIRLARDTGARIHIDHLHSTGGTYNMNKALDLIQNANDSGAEITTCVYPYSYWATYLSSTRFNKGWKERYKITYEDLTIVGTGEKLNETTFNMYRKIHGILVAVPVGTLPLNKTVDLALQRDFCMIGSDGGIEKKHNANNHPRGAGCFATAIRHGIKIGMSLEKILSKITIMPAKLMRGAMDDRGDILDGKIADLVIFDPKEINSEADVINPNQFSKGIDKVILNGDIVFQRENILLSNGKSIRYNI